MILLDTHTLIWWVNQDPSLPRSIHNLIQRQRKKNALAVSSFSIWEIAMLHKKGRLQLTFDLETWISNLLSLPSLQWVPPDGTILLKSVQLPEPFHPDPADRIIVATAQTLGALLVTKDDKLHRYPHVKTYWT